MAGQVDWHRQVLFCDDTICWRRSAIGIARSLRLSVGPFKLISRTNVGDDVTEINSSHARTPMLKEIRRSTSKVIPWPSRTCRALRSRRNGPLRLLPLVTTLQICEIQQTGISNRNAPDGKKRNSQCQRRFRDSQSQSAS